jgi:predicted Zn-dependent protease
MLKYLIIFFCFAVNNLHAETLSAAAPETAEQAGFFSRAELTQIAEWAHDPTIVVCRDAPVSPEAVESAVAWWRSLGYSFWMVVPDSIHYGCIFGNPAGKIIIKLVDGRSFDADKLATTYIYHNEESKKILWAEIVLREEPRERVLEHELGHALGWLHLAEGGHIMHPLWVHSGWSYDGLRKY